MTGGHVHGGSASPPPAERASSSRLLVTLGGAGAVAGALIVLVFAATSPAIEAHRAERLDNAIREVLREPDRYDTMYVTGARMSGDANPDAERVYLGRDISGRPTGFAIVSGAPGFADMIEVIFGYDPTTKTLLGMKVLESKETPGLGDRIEKDTVWVAQFVGVESPLEPVRTGRGTGKPTEVDLITGATISSRTIVRIINEALERLGPALESRGGTPP